MKSWHPRAKHEHHFRWWIIALFGAGVSSGFAQTTNDIGKARAEAAMKTVRRMFGPATAGQR